MKRLFLDLETTGVKPWRHGIHQISIIIEIDGVEKERLNFHVRPNSQCEIEDSALEIAGVTKEQILAYPHMREVKAKIDEVLNKYVSKYDSKDKFHIVGYNNAYFDNPFFRGFFIQCGDNYYGSYFWSNSLDVMVLASKKLESVRHTMPDFKLRTVAEHFGIKVDESKLHDAMYDVDLTRQIFHKL